MEVHGVVINKEALVLFLSFHDNPSVTKTEGFFYVINPEFACSKNSHKMATSANFSGKMGALKLLSGKL